MKSRVEEEREETSDSAFPGQEKGKWIQKTLEERNRETTFLGLLCLSPLCCFLSQLRTTHHNCTVFPPDPSIHPKAEERSQSAPDLSHPMPSNPSSLSTWTPPSFSSTSPPAASLPGRSGISGPCAMPGPGGKFVLRLKSKRLSGAACGVWLRKR